MSEQRPDIIDLALAEDIGPGDITSRWFTREGAQAKAVIVARQKGCLAGVDVAAEVFERIDPSLKKTIHQRDGAVFSKGDKILTVEGCAASILTAERTALNFIQQPQNSLDNFRAVRL